MQADFGILDKLNYQPEFRLPIWDYLAALVDDERIADGKASLARYADVLQRIQATYGVDPATVVAVWGVESNYGRITGKYPLVQALGTLSCFGRRQSYFQGEFFAALRILQRGDIAPEQLRLYLEAGFVVVALDYRLAPETKLPAIVEDLHDGFAWARRESGALGIDRGHIPGYP